MENQIAIKGKKFYEEKLKNILEPDHIGEFVTIEPESGQYFLGKTDGEALHEGKLAMPDKVLFLVRIGFDAVHKIGGFYGTRKRLS
jgi:hypothetical protein